MERGGGSVESPFRSVELGVRFHFCSEVMIPCDNSKVNSKDGYVEALEPRGRVMFRRDKRGFKPSRHGYFFWFLRVNSPELISTME
jgi:hypothetical protein